MTTVSFFFTTIRSFYCSLLITVCVTRLTPVEPPPPAATDEFARFNTCLSGVRVFNGDICINVFMSLVPCCDVRYDFVWKRCSIHVSWLQFGMWGFMFQLFQLYLSTYANVQYDFHITWCSYCLTITQRVPHVEQDLLTPAKHTSSLQLLSGVRVSQFSVFCM